MGSATNVAGSVIVVIGEHSTDFAVLLNSCRPVSLMPFLRPVCIDAGKRPLLVPQVDRFLNLVWIGGMPAVLLVVQLRTHRLQLVLYILKCGIGWYGTQRLAEIGFDTSVIGARIQPGQHAFAVWSHPHTHIERRTFRRLLQRFRTA